eukprot:CAMPEP_0197550508 /NCGR_PEP_ID=MMETSP1320-20131121/4083_1 /TAXON_ID=91990 /ORGANISM="Bolidomonas sp., Strain RCC2347" /LENGTH=108 /DNA_ID=CAMNT_0043110889 /DNA_START=16 /DNA_END=342 /DNA_ORIENTATION=+
MPSSIWLKERLLEVLNCLGPLEPRDDPALPCPVKSDLSNLLNLSEANSISIATINVIAPDSPTQKIVSFCAPSTPKTLNKYIDIRAVNIPNAPCTFSLFLSLRIARLE